jgi:hypothetical protein
MRQSKARSWFAFWHTDEPPKPGDRMKSVATLFRRAAAVAPLIVVGLLFAPLALADGESFTGTLATPESIAEFTFDLASNATVTARTYGFGGGTNQAGETIAAGGTDPFLAVFSGSGSSATILTDSSGNPFGTSLDLSNDSSFAGCPPANSVSDFGATTCGDVSLTLPSLAPGVYTVVLSDGQYIANAVFDNGTLGEGFTDLTGGAFCNIEDSTGVSCPNVSGAYAFDITGLPAAAAPEPGALALLLVGLLGIAGFRQAPRPFCFPFSFGSASSRR